MKIKVKPGTTVCPNGQLCSIDCNSLHENQYCDNWPDFFKHEINKHSNNPGLISDIIMYPTKNLFRVNDKNLQILVGGCARVICPNDSEPCNPKCNYMSSGFCVYSKFK